MINEANILTEKYRGKKFDEIMKDFTVKDIKTCSVVYNDQHYFIILDRLDFCKKFILCVS